MKFVYQMHMLYLYLTCKYQIVSSMNFRNKNSYFFMTSFGFGPVRESNRFQLCCQWNRLSSPVVDFIFI